MTLFFFQVGQTRVLIAADQNPLIIPALIPKSLVIRNAGVTPITLKLHCDNPLFSVVGNPNLRLEPEQNNVINIKLTPNKIKDENISGNPL